MSDKIRRIEEKDFQSVSELFDHKKSIEELKWLFTNPDNHLVYNAFVSVDANNIITGVIGFISSVYSDSNITSIGVIPMSWQLKKDYKGIAGVLLFKKILQKGDFAIAIEGSKIAQDLYKLFKYRFLSRSYTYVKILDLKNYFKYTKGLKLITRLGLIGVCFLNYLKNPIRKSHKDVEVNLSTYDGVIHKNIVNSNSFGKVITKNYVDWILNCPVLKSFAFNIKKGNENIGICIFYINEINNVKVGRIVHLPFLGNNELLWEKVISECLTFFKKKDCCLVSGLAHHKMCQKGYKKSGFYNIYPDGRPVYIKDANKKLETVNLEEWHIQFSEGDKAYRGF